MAAAVRFSTPSFTYTFSRCFCTVRTLASRRSRSRSLKSEPLAVEDVAHHERGARHDRHRDRVVDADARVVLAEDRLPAERRARDAIRDAARAALRPRGMETDQRMLLDEAVEARLVVRGDRVAGKAHDSARAGGQVADAQRGDLRIDEARQALDDAAHHGLGLPEGAHVEHEVQGLLQALAGQANHHVASPTQSCVFPLPFAEPAPRSMPAWW